MPKKSKKTGKKYILTSPEIKIVKKYVRWKPIYMYKGKMIQDNNFMTEQDALNRAMHVTDVSNISRFNVVPVKTARFNARRARP